MAWVRRPIAVCLIASVFVLGRGPAVQGHNLTVDHRAAAYCIVDQFGNAGLQSYVANMDALPFQTMWISPGGWYGGTSYTPIYSPRYIYYLARAWWWTGSSWSSRDGNWLRAVGQMGQATAPWLTSVWTSSGWKPATVNLLYNGADNARPDSSLISLPGRGSYYIEGYFYWAAVTDAAGRVVVNALSHWEPLGWKQCS
jgi:hypothetical protein